MEENIQTMMNKAPEFIATYGLKIVLAILVFYVGKAIARALSNFLGKTMSGRGIDLTVSNFIKNLAYYGMFTMVVVAALGQLGVQTASFVAIIGAAGLAVGFALQGSLANFAAGVLLILFRPFKAGDYIQAGGTAGVVKDVSIFTTTLMSPDNVTIIVANGSIFSGNIHNFSTAAERRVDLVVGVSYGADLDLVKKELKALTDADERILKDKDVTIAVSELADSSVNLVVRPWVASADYWGVKFDLTENIKKRFDEVGIEIPFPQMDVHMEKVA